ncbi:MAG: type II toxin-antitoxin system RelE/ParE family toxin [Lachnospiraceae bacterium]|nr:type II toxin-antitoxin system RelE/ParE family toxin [Lachnospiraceae bacterium]
MAVEYDLKFSGAAREDIESINKYISEELCNPLAATALDQSFREALRRVCANPHICPLVNNNFVKDATLRKLPVKNYIIFYRPDDILHEIQVIRVLYGMRNFKDIL